MNGIVTSSNMKPIAKGVLSGVTVSFKDCICVKGLPAQSSSKILKGYIPSFNATCVEKILSQGGTIIGKTAQDEFGFGSFGINNSYDLKNPVDPTRVPGGSSSGSAIAAKTIKNHLAIAESTGGSIVNPAAFCQVFGACPTYGRVSRYGLIDYANSLDKIGVMANTLELTAKGLTVISGNCSKDSTSVDLPAEDFSKFETFKGILGVPKEYVENLSPEVKQAFQLAIEKLKSKGIQIKNISLALNAKYSIPSYYVIALSETSTNLAKYSGLRYGPQSDFKLHYNDYFTKVRQNFGVEAKRRVILGTFTRMAGYRSAYYIKALKVRTLLIEEYKKAFKQVSAIIHPTMPILPPKIKDTKNLSPIEIYNMDLLTAGVNLAGLPHLTVPIGEMVGMLITTNHFEERKMFSVGGLL